ncbi:MAG: hypothetical protein BWY88_00991 [Synergistetes bacterium ADurb.Bin520]|nr:MAG: hypothetical protein BWY88_00991 [Synergistetes bacterium ADurb.Bin520]
MPPDHMVSQMRSMRDLISPVIMDDELLSMTTARPRGLAELRMPPDAPAEGAKASEPRGLWSGGMRALFVSCWCTGGGVTVPPSGGFPSETGKGAGYGYFAV